MSYLYGSDKFTGDWIKSRLWVVLLLGCDVLLGNRITFFKIAYIRHGKCDIYLKLDKYPDSDLRTKKDKLGNL